MLPVDVGHVGKLLITVIRKGKEVNIFALAKLLFLSKLKCTSERRTGAGK